jgi:hypothetical protein
MTSSRLSRALRLVVAGLVAVVPLGLWAAFVVDGRHRALDVAEADTRRLVATVAEHATRLLDAQALVLEVMERAAGGRDCAALRVDAGLQASMAAMVRRASGTETAWVLDVDGTLCAASDPARLDDRSRADREYFVAARAAPTGQDIVGRAISGRIDDVPAFTLARRRGGVTPFPASC